MDELFLIAEIKAVHGTNGFLLIDSFSDFSERFFELDSVYLDLFGSLKEFFVENVAEFNGRFALKFKGFETNEDVKILLGKKIYVDQGHAVKLSEGTYFIHDLIGSKVFREFPLSQTNPIREFKFIGCIEDVIVLPSNDVYVISDVNKKKILVPAVKDFIKFFDPVQKRLELMPDCDLLYDDEN